ncbi:MAG TPA: hypothetical protein VGM39_13930, partial [Kofleriaceae bacterium]
LAFLDELRERRLVQLASGGGVVSHAATLSKRPEALDERSDQSGHHADREAQRALRRARIG